MNYDIPYNKPILLIKTSTPLHEGAEEDHNIILIHAWYLDLPLHCHH